MARQSRCLLYTFTFVKAFLVGEASREGWLAPCLIFIATVVALVSSLGAPLIPTIAAVDSVEISTAQWSLTVTVLVGAVATPMLGRLADGPRRRVVLLGALAVVCVGCVLAALPAGFGWLLAGRAMQGCGVGLGALAMGVARDALGGERARKTMAALAITTVAGVGLGYPVTGLLADQWGVHAAFWAGAGFSAAAWVVAFVSVRDNPDRPRSPVDVTGAMVLAGALVALLLAVSRGERWGWGSSETVGCLVAGGVLAAVWTRYEMRRRYPLVDLRLLSNHGVLAAHVTSLIAGGGMYLLLSLITRFVQTPSSEGYGFGASVVLSGLILVPFSISSVLANRLLRLLAVRIDTALIMPFGACVFVGALILLATSHTQLWEMFAVMAVAGLGAGCTFAAMPAMIVSAVPPDETASSMALNQVLRAIGFAVGSALSATVLDAFTRRGAELPRVAGYTTGALIGAGIWLVGALICLALGRKGTHPAGAAASGSGSLPEAADAELLA
jgi:predicted MFS family arabinose efflux permease